MADFLKSANFNGTNGSHFYIQLYQSYTQDINANTSTVTYTLYFGSQDGYSGSGATYTGYIGKNYNGRASVGSGSSIGRNTKITIGSRTLTYNHNADGTCSASYYALLDTPWTLGDASLSGSFTLKTIPRASSITATSADVGATSIINITRASSSFTHTLSYNFDGITGTIVSKTSQTSYSWTIPDSFYAQLSDVMHSTGKTCTITCDTYNGSTKIGTKTTTMKVTVADNNTTKPTLSATYSFDSLTETLTGVSDKSIAIRGVTDVTISAVTAIPQSVNGSAVATIASKRVDCGSQYRTTAGTINNIDSDKIVVSATDSRGISNSRTYTTTLKPYINLTIVPNFYRTNPTESTVKLTYTGKYYNDNFGSTSETANTLTLKYRYREATSSTWSNYVNLTPTISGNDYSNGSSEITIGTDFDYQKAYKFEIVATDKVGSITKIETVTQGIPVFDWDKDDFQFNVPVTVNGSATVNSSATVNGNTTVKGNLYEAQSNGNNATDVLLGRGCVVGQGSTASSSGTYYKFASISLSSTNVDRTIHFNVYAGYYDNSTKIGQLTAHVRTNGSGYYSSGELIWEYANNGINPADFYYWHNTSTTPTKVELYVHCTTSYQCYHFDVISEGDRQSRRKFDWTLYTNTTSGGGVDAIPTGSSFTSSRGDIIVSSSTASNATRTSYKFSNGLLINTIKYPYTNIGCNTAWGGTYASATQTPGAYQTAFTTLLSVTASVRPTSGNHWYMFTESSESLTNAPQFQLLRGTKTNVSGWLCVTAFGLWK